MAWETAAVIINDAAIELGLITTEVQDPFASKDANIIQLRRLLKSVGRELVREHQWTHLQKQATITTVASQSAYSLPVDYGRHIDNTGWNRTTQFPLGGPVSAAGWQFLKAVSYAGQLYTLFRTVNGEIQIHPTPTGTATLSYEYISRLWVTIDGELVPQYDTPENATDTLALDALLLVRGLKLAFLKAKGFDTSAAQGDYDRTLQQAKAGDGAAPVLILNQRGPQDRLIDVGNIPQTGFGQ